MKMKIVFGIVVLIAVVSGIYYYLPGKHNPLQGERAIVVRERTEGSITSAGAGSSKYSNSEWELSFVYPNTWDLSEHEYNKKLMPAGGLATVRVAGDGYVLDFTNSIASGKSSAAASKTSFMIAGHEVPGYEEKSGEGLKQTIFACKNLFIQVESPGVSTKTTDKIITSVQCQH